MKSKNSGFLVKTKDGRIGRTYHSKGVVNGKIPVYLGENYEDVAEGYFAPEMFPKSFSETATLFSSTDLQKIGFID